MSRRTLSWPSQADGEASRGVVREVASVCFEMVDRVIVLFAIALLTFVQIWLVSQEVAAGSDLVAVLNAAYGILGVFLLVYVTKPFLGVGWRHRGSFVGKAVVIATLMLYGYVFLKTGAELV